jgi:TldD protein
MKDLLETALNYASLKGAGYSEARMVRRRTETIIVKNGRIHTLHSHVDEGFSIRVLWNGVWGFAASSILEKDEAEDRCRLAIDLAKAASLTKRQDIVLSEEDVIRDTHKNPFIKDPFRVPLDEKVSLLLATDKAMRREPKVKVTSSHIFSSWERRLFMNSEGSLIEEETVACGGGIEAVAVDEGEVQKRSWPNINGDYATKGYEFIDSLDLLGNAERVAEEAVRLLSAPHCPSKVTTIILDGGQMALQIHESIGHPIELDRVLGGEESFAGGSFLGVEKLNSFQYASPIVNVYADATIPGGFGSFGYDDEGVRAKRVPIIVEGRFVGYLSSRQTAPILNTKSSGAARASGWGFIPLVRMTNINLEPGDLTKEEMISEVKDGLYMETNKSWSIDERRLNFQFGTEIAWEIKDGRLGRVLKNPTYTGMTPQFWNSCDAIGKDDEWRVWGVPNCAKGEPTQTIRVGHGTSPARFRNIKVGY